MLIFIYNYSKPKYCYYILAVEDILRNKAFAYIPSSSEFSERQYYQYYLQVPNLLKGSIRELKRGPGFGLQIQV